MFSSTACRFEENLDMHFWQIRLLPKIWIFIQGRYIFNPASALSVHDGFSTKLPDCFQDVGASVQGCTSRTIQVGPGYSNMLNPISPLIWRPVEIALYLHNAFIQILVNLKENYSVFEFRINRGLLVSKLFASHLNCAASLNHSVAGLGKRTSSNLSQLNYRHFIWHWQSPT